MQHGREGVWGGRHGHTEQLSFAAHRLPYNVLHGFPGVSTQGWGREEDYIRGGDGTVAGLRPERDVRDREPGGDVDPPLGPQYSGESTPLVRHEEVLLAPGEGKEGGFEPKRGAHGPAETEAGEGEGKAGGEKGAGREQRVDWGGRIRKALTRMINIRITLHDKQWIAAPR